MAPPVPKKGAEPPNFRPISVVASTDAWMDQSVSQDQDATYSREVGLGPGHIVLDGDLAPPPQRGTAPNFRPISVVAKWLDGSRCHLVGR